MTAVVAAIVIAGLSVQRDVRYQNLVAAGNRALATDQNLRRHRGVQRSDRPSEDSMIAYLRRGESYRRARRARVRAPRFPRGITD